MSGAPAGTCIIFPLGGLLAAFYGWPAVWYSVLLEFWKDFLVNSSKEDPWIRSIGHRAGLLNKWSNYEFSWRNRNDPFKWIAWPNTLTTFPNWVNALWQFPTTNAKGWFTWAACGCGRLLHFRRDRNFSIFPHHTLLPQPHMSNAWISLKAKFQSRLTTLLWFRKNICIFNTVGCFTR